ncbi:MAG: hypothetical protein A2289_07095 [Deltaproteobacteria bacterium RIFOXYA12_FULL_58_15]|nr:MAG: hypothetical protein A2289_07095 [Deltaproteobacteria bacterium RIFOXYA12_FULL_58_15]
MNRLQVLVAVSILIQLLTSCADPPQVIQGAAVSYDDTSKVLLVRDERPPQSVSEFSLGTAEIGASPVEGDLLRISYRVREGKNQAIRVMNRTRQAELSGGGGH